LNIASLRKTLPFPFAITHLITFRPFKGPAEVIPVMLRMGEIWTQMEWEALAPDQDWTHEHEWIIQDGEWWWTHGVNGLSYTPGNRSGEIVIVEAT
jgi:hypothetical protein